MIHSHIFHSLEKEEFSNLDPHFQSEKKRKKSRKEKISEFHNRDAIVLDEEVARFFSSSVPFSKRSFSNIRYREQYRAYIAHFYFTQWLG